MDSDHFFDYLKELLLLHETVEINKGDNYGAYADAIRDRMEIPWYRMTTHQRELVTDVSATLLGGSTAEIFRNMRNQWKVVCWFMMWEAVGALFAEREQLLYSTMVFSSDGK